MLRRSFIATGLVVLVASGSYVTYRATRRAPDAEVGEICLVAPPTPFDPASGLAMNAPRSIPPSARCPVCGMFPARAPEWAAQVLFDNGDAQFFDSPLSLFIYLQDVGRYTRGRTAAQIVAKYVRDFDSGQWLDAHNAVYVQGSSALGPMRAGNFPAFADAAAAQRFIKLHGGQVIDAAGPSPELLQQLSGKSRHAH